VLATVRVLFVCWRFFLLVLNLSEHKVGSRSHSARCYDAYSPNRWFTVHEQYPVFLKCTMITVTGMDFR
jgi:hypothetical protein